MSLEYLTYHIRTESYDLPIDWNKVFGREGKLAVEIGFGNGEFLLQLAKQEPFNLFVGFETSLTSLVKIQKRLFAERVSNVRVCLVDGRFALREFFQDMSISTVYVNFPCPWPKRSHESRRFTSVDFAHTLAAVLAQEGIFSLTSDVPWYVEDMKNILLSTDCFQVESYQMNKEVVIGTRYEKKWIAEGRETYTLKMRKTKHRTVSRITWEGQGMPHVHLRTVNEEKILALANGVFKFSSGAFVVKAVYKKEGEYLLRIVSNEENFQQRYFIRDISFR